MKYKKLPTLDFIENLRFPYRTITPIILILTLLTCTAYTGTSNGQVNRYWVGLVPKVVSDGIGFVGFKFSDDFNELIYTVNVHKIDNITGVYLYLTEYLLKLMREGKLYIAVYTKDHADGELMGDSFIGMDDVFHDADEFNW